LVLNGGLDAAVFGVRIKNVLSGGPFMKILITVRDTSGSLTFHRESVPAAIKKAAEDPLEAISGTNGVTGAADAVLVLNRDAKGTTLYGRGRDIEEIETAMRFDGGRWSILGDADEVRRSDERRKIVSALREASDELTPAAIAKLAGMKAENVRVLLRKMVKDGEVMQPRVGYYAAPVPVRVP
jgi:hypothetical protein